MRSELDIQIPANNADMEAAVLGALMMSNDTLHMTMPRLFTELFYQDANKAVFRAIEQLYMVNATIDILSVFAQLKRNGADELVGGPFYLTKLQANVVSSAHLETHIGILSELYLKRELGRLSYQAHQRSYQDETDAFDILSAITSGVEKAHQQVLNGHTRDVTYYLTEMLKQQSEVKATGVLGIRTGLESIDWSIGGLVAPDLIVIAARPGQGKTALALSITHNLTIKNGIPGAWFSFEMDGVQLMRRLVSISSGVDHERIRNGRTTDEEDRKISITAGHISSCKLFIEDQPVMTIRDIRAKATLLYRKQGIKYIVVDYLQLMEGDRSKYNASREQVVSDISRGLKIIAKELGIPVIALSQLNRSVESRADKLPNLSDLRESGAIEQDADEVIFIMRPEYYGITDGDAYGGNSVKGLAVIKVDKNRHGETGIFFSHFDGARMMFSNYKPT